MNELKAGKYQAYPEYKDSGVEWIRDIPSGWELKPTFALFDQTAHKNLDGVETNVLSLSYGRIVKRDVEKNFGLLPESFNTYQIVNSGDIILRLTDLQNDKRSLRVGLAKQNGIITSAYLKLATKSELNSRFVYRLLHSYDTTKVFYGMGGGLRQSMKFEDFRRLPILVPALEEQIQIANFLDHETAKIDTLIEKQQQLIKLLKEKRQAVISHAVTKGLNPQAPMKDSGVEWLGEVPAHWIASTLKHYSEVIDCKHITAEFFDDGIPLASISEVKKWFVDLSTAKYTSEKYYNELIGGGREPKVGDIIYSRNATVGEAAIVSEGLPPFAMGQDVCLIRLSNGLLPLFAMYVLHSGVISQQLELAMVGSTFKRINVDNIRNFAFVIPPLSEQDLIVSELEALTSKYDVLINNSTNAIELMQERRTALISAAVTGKIDVRNWEHPND
ncbi:restriction endonuclease subunit S [Pseudoalteromonas sp. SG43-7]|uniref:restriction endonuclease subunit S n=1 Tax=unclassified Pseudoalteromonas TaxID=194690 RepID=UPI00160355B9|nr:MULTISPECIES: restriction endonuclease subunit S [unclassified Pseudoalteromonas]MBB1295103.1 restriction endonuclease subunit S [Pseudoalteromonas sp. SR41-4]MBB1421643.1 restriction endonuclease subunit S [Pseudoalteromonas sp. SG43-7]